MVTQQKIHRYAQLDRSQTRLNLRDDPSEFAAKHLPALMKAYRENSGARNTSMMMLNSVSYTWVHLDITQSS